MELIFEILLEILSTDSKLIEEESNKLKKQLIIRLVIMILLIIVSLYYIMQPEHIVMKIMLAGTILISIIFSIKNIKLLYIINKTKPSKSV